MVFKKGDDAPAFTLPDQDGKKVSLSDFRGQWLLVYFYPKDNTPGCTQEACAFAERWPDFARLGLHIVGISPDSSASHRKFADKFKLKFTLLSDENHAVIEAYGAWGLKKFMGKEYMGVIRSSVLIDPLGKVARVYPQVKPEVHAAEVQEDYCRLTQS